ncbi:hypothetical protein KCU95_g14887, partial [Aureobasidium melanogenum]
MAPKTPLTWPITPSGKHDQWCINLASHLRMLGDDPCSASSAAFASSLRENADLIFSAQVHNMPIKQQDASVFKYIISTTIADTYGTEAAQARPLVEQNLRVAETIYWFKLVFGDGALALLVQSKWKKTALKAWDFRVPAVLRHLAAANPSLVKVRRIAETNIWSCFDNAEGLKVPRHLKYEKYNEKQIGRAGLFELLCSEFEDAAVL